MLDDGMNWASTSDDVLKRRTSPEVRRVLIECEESRTLLLGAYRAAMTAPAATFAVKGELLSVIQEIEAQERRGRT